jgi:hypothetical protein
MQALRLADGSEAWRVAPRDADIVVAGPLNTESGILLPFHDRLALYDPATGELIDERPLAGESLRDVIVTGAGTYALAVDGTLTAYR